MVRAQQQLVESPLGDPPEGHVAPQGWPLPPCRACEAPWTRHKRELTPLETLVGFLETYFSKMHYIYLVILETSGKIIPRAKGFFNFLNRPFLSGPQTLPTVVKTPGTEESSFPAGLNASGRAQCLLSQ